MNNIVHEDNRLFSQQIDPSAASESENLLGQKVDPHKPTLRFLLISLEIPPLSLSHQARTTAVIYHVDRHIDHSD